MILEVHTDLAKGPNEKDVLKNFCRGAENAAIKVKVIKNSMKEKIDPNNFSLLWRYRLGKNDRILNRILSIKKEDRLFYINNNFMKAYHNEKKEYTEKANYRLMYKSIFETNAVYPNKSNNLCSTFFTDHTIPCKDWSNNSEYVLILPNKENGFGRDSQNVQEWIIKNIYELTSRKIDHKNIILKPHPGSDFKNLYKKHISKSIVSFDTIKQIAQKYPIKLCIIFNSTASCECLLEGLPCFIQSPGNVAYKYSNVYDWNHINNINLDIDRHAFINEASKKMWNIKDISSGAVWKGIMEKIND